MFALKNFQKNYKKIYCKELKNIVIKHIKNILYFNEIFECCLKATVGMLIMYHKRIHNYIPLVGDER